MDTQLTTGSRSLNDLCGMFNIPTKLDCEEIKYLNSID